MAKTTCGKIVDQTKLEETFVSSFLCLRGGLPIAKKCLITYPYNDWREAYG